MDEPDVLEHLMAALSAFPQDQLTRRENAQTGPKLQRLDKVLDMSKACSMSNTIAFLEGVDLESINKRKCVNDGYVNFESDVTTLEGHLVLMLRSLKSKRRGSKRRSRSEQGGTCTEFQITRTVWSGRWHATLSRRTGASGMRDWDRTRAKPGGTKQSSNEVSLCTVQRIQAARGRA